MRLHTPLLGLLVTLVLVGRAYADTPKRAMVLVFDQMRAEYIERFDMKNFKRAQAMGLQFDNGIVGHLESNTIVSHPVISTGKLPKNLPWGSHVMKDTRGLVGKKDAYYTPFLLTSEQYMQLHRATSGDTSIVARVKAKNPGPSLAVAQKNYAALNFGGPYADHIVCLGSAFKSGPWKGHHQIQGIRVPDYISKPVGNRFYLDATNDWGSGQEIYQFHGNGFLTGHDRQRPGGDIWVGDVVEKFMANEPDWSVILASFGSIDKVGHVLAEHDQASTKPWAVKNKISLREATRKADLELGRLLDRLESTGLIKETAILITADHGGQHSKHFHGHTYPGAHLDNLWIGLNKDANTPPSLKSLASSGMIEIASINTIMSFWTRPLQREEAEDFIDLVSQAPGVAQIYRKTERFGEVKYRLEWQSPKLRGRELRWAQSHHPQLVDTMASETGPQFIGLLFDQHGYDVPGSHGGAQELVQRIPYIFISPNLKSPGRHSSAWTRLVDVNAILGKALELDDHERLDGSYEAVLPHLR